MNWTAHDLVSELKEAGERSRGRRGGGRGGGGGSRHRRRGGGRGGGGSGGHGRRHGSVGLPATEEVDCDADETSQRDHRTALEARGDLSTTAVQGALAFSKATAADPNGDTIPYSLIAELVNFIDREDPLEKRRQEQQQQQQQQQHQPGPDRNSAIGGSILVFVPGFSEIVKVRESLQSNPRLLVLPLHGSMPTNEQRAVFRPAPAGRRKVVVATNIAESSITIEDISYVVDSGRHKEKTYDEEANLACLLPAWVSRASAHQRRGRAGRVRDGQCYHMFPRYQLRDMDE